MRLGMGLKDQMKAEIISDLYDKNIDLMINARNQIVVDNYREWLATHSHNIAALPDGFINRGHDVAMCVPSALGVNANSSDGTFEARSDVEIPICIDRAKSHYYNRPLAVPISDTFKQAFIENKDELENLNKEKLAAIAYIDKSYEQCTSTNQLREFWPQSLTKYIPPEPVRAKAQKKELDTSSTKSIESVLAVRMANNLLGG